MLRKRRQQNFFSFLLDRNPATFTVERRRLLKIEKYPKLREETELGGDEAKVL